MKLDSKATAIQAGRVLPSHVRFGVPLLILGITALFLCAHLLHGASALLKGSALGQSLEQVANEDNLLGATRRLAQSGAWECVVLVAVLSGILPYVKLLGTWLCVFLVDFGFLRLAWGHKVLVVLEAVGKYSFADVFMLTTNVMIFDISTGGPYQLAGFGSFELHMYYDIHFPGLALIIAVAFSSTVTHWAVYEIRRLELEEYLHDDAEHKPLLEDEGFANADSGREGKKITRMAAGTLVLAVISLAFIIVGSILPYLEVDRSGFLGNLIRPHEEKKLEISIFNTVSKLADGGRMYQTFAGLSFIFSFVMPVLELLMIAVSAIGILKSGVASNLSRYCRFASDACHSLSCIEMVLIVAAVTVAELHTVVQFNIGDTCKPFAMLINNKMLLDIAGLGFAASEECFNPKAALRKGFFWLLGACVLRIVASRLLPARYVSTRMWSGCLRKTYPQMIRRDDRHRLSNHSW
mmetsp:Transcript_39564/g.84316  ORF Transcript_39564/g.84316 Transcript_39564/m.84316 type:complete len:466 (+) Transcript_39564:190-1587(+)